MHRLPVLIPLLFSLSMTANAQTWQFRTLAGSAGGGGAADGPAAEARLSRPSGVVACTDAIFIADTGNHAIRRLSRDGQVTTWAGALMEAGSADGDRLAARFRYPSGISADSQCNLYIAERGNHTIRKISSAGLVTTVAGTAGMSGSTDGTGAAARFDGPRDLVVDSDGTISVVDTGNNRVRRISADGRVQTINRTLSIPTGIGIDAAGTVFVADRNNRSVLRITREGSIGTAFSSSTIYPSDVAFDRNGALYLVDYASSTLKRVENGVATDVAGSTRGTADGTGNNARFDQPYSIVFDSVTDSFVIAEETGCTLRRATREGVVTTIAGTPAAVSAHVDGTATNARFVVASDVDVDANGIAYVADATTVRRVARDGVTTTIAGTPGEALHRDGSRGEARLRGVSGIAVEPAGAVVVIDGNTIRRVSMNGDVATIAGSPTASGHVDAAGESARFNYPVAIAVAADGTIYVADAFNRAIRKIAGNTVTTLATSNDFLPPMGGIDVDDAGSVYLWNENGTAVFRVTPAGVVSTVASDPRLINDYNGLAVAPDGTIYIGGFRSHAILRLSPGSSTFEQFAGDVIAIGNQNGPAAVTRFHLPHRLDVAPDGRLFVTDANRAIRVASFGEPPTIASFVATPAFIQPGASATLTWSTSGGDARIEPGIGAVASEGSVVVTPTIPTSYSLIVTNAAGEVRAEASVLLPTPRRRSSR